MIKKSILLFFGGAIFLQGCSTIGPVKFDQIMEEKVAKKASFDFECDSKELKVIKIDNGSYGVIGCGKKGTYVALNSACNDHSVESYVRKNCRVVPDTFVKNN